MPKTITITIHEPHLAVLEKWAAVNRTLDTAYEDIDDSVEEPESDLTLEELTPALDHLLHQFSQGNQDLAAENQRLRNIIAEMDLATDVDEVLAILSRYNASK